MEHLISLILRIFGKELSTLANNIKEWNAKVVGIKAEKENIKKYYIGKS